MKQFFFLLIAMSLTVTSFSQQRDTVKTDDGVIIININPDKPKASAPPKSQQQKPQAPTAKEPIVIDLTINHEQQPVPVYIPDNKGNNNGLVTWLWVLTTALLVLITALVTLWILSARRRAYYRGVYGDGYMFHFGSIDHDGHMQHSGQMNHSGTVRHEHHQMSEKKS